MNSQAVAWAAVLGTALMLAGCEEKQPAPKAVAPTPATTIEYAPPRTPPEPAKPIEKSAPATTELPSTQIPIPPREG